MSGRRPYVLLTAVAMAVACSGPRSKPGPSDRVADATRRGPGRGEALKGPQRRDKPQQARDFYVKKRAPVGSTTIPVERYREAREQMGRMPLYSTRTGSLAPRRTGGVGSAANVAVGTWSSLGPGNIGGRTRAIAIDPATPTTMYAGGVAGGVWKTTNGGTTWSAESDDMANLAVTTIALRPGAPATILAGTGEGYFNADSVRGAGIFRSTDSGGTWTQISAPGDGSPTDFHYVNKIVFLNANTAFAATGSGVYRSTNGGTSWTKVLTPSGGGVGGGILIGGCLDLAVRTDEPTLFASCGTFTQARVYRTTNADTGGALNWTSYNPSLDGADLGAATYLTEPQMGRTTLAIAPSDQDVIYAVAADNQGDFLWAVYYSNDGGASWQTRAPVGSLGFESALLLTNPPFAWPCSAQGFGGQPNYYNQGWYDNAVAVDPSNPNVVWVGGIDIFRSDDGGFNFGLASFWWPDPSEPAYAHADQHTIVFHPQYNGTSNKQVFFGNDGGIFKSVTPDGVVQTGENICNPPALGTGPVTFTSLNNGYGVTQFYYGAVFPNDEQYMGGTQDNGTIVGSDASGQIWSEVLGGDGGSVAVDPDNPLVLYGEFTGLSIQKSTNGGTSWIDAITGINDTGFLFIAPFIIDPSDSDFLYAGGTYLWRTQNKAASWQRASASTGSNVSAIAVAPSNGGFALLGTADGYIHRNANARAASSSTAWAKVRPRQGYVSSVAFDPYDPNVAYATYSSFGGVHLYKSLNAGATWTAAGAGIPDVPAHSVVVDPTTDDPGQPRRIYVGTDIGVFVSLDGGSTWNQENTQFPNTVTEQLVVSGANLYAFTHGRGVFRVPLTTSNNATIRLDMAAASQSVPENAGQASVQFKLRTPNHLPTSGITTLNYTITPGTATLTDDFTAVSGAFSIPTATADEAILNVPVANIVNDAFGEPVETFTVNFDPPAGVVLSRTAHTVSITNDSGTPDPVGVNILDLAVSEGNGPGNTTASVVVQLDYPADTAFSVDYTTMNGSALAGVDYSTRSGTLNFVAGQTGQTIPVPIFGDACPETPKSFLVNVLPIVGAGVVVDGQATVLINDNDLSGTFQLSTPRVTVAESAAKAMVTVTRTGGLGGGAANCVGFSLRTQSGSATAPSDFTAVGPGTFFFAAGATSKVVEVPIVNDTEDEPEESFVVELLSTVGPGAALGAQQTQVVAITDNDTAGMLQFSATALTVAEGADTATLTVTRTGGNTGPLTVDVLTSGTATAGGVDFTAPAQLTFNANQTSAALVVDINDTDVLSEGNEVVNFTLANPTLGATIGAKSTAALTITDDEATVFFSAATFTASESAASAVITVKRAGPLSGAVTVNYASNAGSASPGASGDYNNVTGVLTFAPNVSSRTFTLPLLPDFVAEGANETVNLSLNSPTGATIGTTQPTAVLNILENDFGGTVFFGAATYAPKEPLNTSLTPTKLSVIIKRTGGVAQGATVLLSTVNGSATSGADFTGVTNKSVVFPAGKASVTEIIEILNDSMPEGPHSFNLTLTSPSVGASLGSPATATVTIADNEPVIEWSAATFAGKEPLGAAATSVVNLTLKRTGSTLGPATIDVRVLGGGSATLGSDFVFTPNPRTVSLPSGKSSVTVPITINQDGLFEGVETVLLQLETAAGAAVGPLANTTLKITDEEPTVQFSLTAYLVSEPGGSTPTSAVITVKRTGKLTSGTNVSFATSDLTATAGQDYTAVASTLNFPSNSATQTFTVPILPDLNDEIDETFRVTLSGPAAASLGTPFQADVKIKDNDTAGKLQFQAAVASVSEGGGAATLTVTRTAGTGLATVSYATQSGAGTGGANSGTDFDVTTGTLTFNPGENSKIVTVNITPDGLVEGGEYFSVVLSSPGNGATLGTVVTATVWIVDGD